MCSIFELIILTELSDVTTNIVYIMMVHEFNIKSSNKKNCYLVKCLKTTTKHFLPKDLIKEQKNEEESYFKQDPINK